jgi:hypothetical protein
MTTLAVMKARIGTELRRSNLTTQIASAISTAIGALEDERWTFTESRSLTFSTVANQEFYGASDSALIPRLEKIDYAKIVISDYPYDLVETSPSEVETLNRNGTQTGEPVRYCYYAQQIRLAYVPSDVWTVRIGGVVRVPEPASDSEANNPWMTTAERLVRSRAKLELALHVLRDRTLAEDMKAAFDEAEMQLRRRTNRIQGGSMICEGSGW